MNRYHSGLVPWWKWPKNINYCYLPWYIAGWRLLWYPLVVTSALVFVVSVGVSFGLTEAKDTWRELL